MKLSKWKELLEQGVITQEEFDEMSKTAEDDAAGDQDDKGGDEDPDNDDDSAKQPGELTAADIQRMIDRATNKLGNENKKLKDELDKTRKAKMTAEELRQVELEEQARELEEKRKEIQEKECRMYAISALKEAGLDDGSKDTMNLIDFVLGEDEAAIDSKVKALKVFADRIVKNTTDGIYRENGRQPGKGNSGGGKNPWSKESWNLTKQMELELTNPALADTYKAAAGK